MYGNIHHPETKTHRSAALRRLHVNVESLVLVDEVRADVEQARHGQDDRRDGGVAEHHEERKQPEIMVRDTVPTDIARHSKKKVGGGAKTNKIN